MSTSVSDQQAGIKLKSVIILVGLTPALMVIAPWDFGSDMNPYRGFLRGHSLTATLVEMVVVLLAMARGFSPSAAVRALPWLSKLGAILFLAVAIWNVGFVAKIPIFALLGLSKIVMHALFFLALRDQLIAVSDTWHVRLWTAIGGGVIAYCLIWAASIFIFPPVGDDWLLRVPGLTNVRGAGFFAVAGFFAGIAMLPERRLAGLDSWRALFALLVSTAGLSLAFWTGSRGGVFAILVGVMLLIALASTWRRLLWFSLTVAALATLASYPLPVVHPSYGIERIIFSSLPSSSDGDPSSGRTQMWRDTAQKIGQRPLTGWGIDQFSNSGPAATLGYKQPHNIFLQLLFSTGLLGALAVFLVVAPLALKLKMNLSKPDELAAWGYIFGALVFGLYDAAFYYTFPVMIFLLAVASIDRPIMMQPATDTSN